MVKKFTTALAGLTREQMSGGTMAVGVVSIGIGVGIVAGAGFGILAFGACLVGVALLLGWT